MNSMKRQKDRTLKDELSVGAQYATGEQLRNNSRKNEETEPRQKQCPVVGVTGDRSKVWCRKEQYCIGTGMLGPWIKANWKWSNRRWQEWTLINELKWGEMGEFNPDDHYIYYGGRESLRRNWVAIIVNKSPKCSTWMQSQKRQNDLCLFPRQTIQYHSNPSLCPNH